MRALRPFVLLAGLASALAAGACTQPSSPPPATDATIPDSADQVIFGGRTALAEGGLRRGELRFDTAFVYDQGRRFELKGVNATFFEATTAIAFADFARYPATEDRIEVAASGKTRLSRRTGGLRKTLRFWLHFVTMPVQVGAATSPQSMQNPLLVDWL